MSLEDFAAKQEEIDSLRSANHRLQRQLRDAKDRQEQLVRATMQGAYDAMMSMGPIKPTVAPKNPKRKAQAEVALWHLTDWQGSKVTPSYNSQIMVERVMRFCDKAEKITAIQRADHPVNHCVIAFGGDLVEGLFNFATQPFEVDQTIFGQFVTVSRLIVDVVKRALSIYDTVEVIAEPGNHGRLGSKRDAIPRGDNTDRMTAELARQLLLSEPRLIWDPDHGSEDIQRIEIGNYRALLIHGDEVGRNGFASPSTMIAHINRWKAGAYVVNGEHWPFSSCYVGHFHRHAEEPLADGASSVYWTGSPESENRYARDSMAASGRPSQRLHFIHPEKGIVTSQYRVLVDE